MLNNNETRRTFLKSATTGSLAAVGGFSFLSGLPAVTADDVKLSTDLVQFDAQIEPIVRLIEESSREQLLERIAARIQKGLSYREVLAALLLAGIRNVQPRPSVGFKFHCVLVVNSCHLASLSGPVEDRWLPIFWALDHFKSSQADEAQSSGWRMKAVKESLVPDAVRSRSYFIEAMENWDEELADVATAGLVRTAGVTEVFNLFAQYAARDFRSIGHKAIYLANSWRTLQIIGWKHAEPVLRSLAFALLNHTDEPDPATHDLDADRPWRENAEKLSKVPENWLSGQASDSVPDELLQVFRSGTTSAAADATIDVLVRGIAPQSVWDGVFLGAGELLMRQPGIIGLHGLTTANAMHYLWKNVADNGLRSQLLLQACAFNPLFRNAAKGRGALADKTISDVQPVALESTGDEAIAEILNEISRDKMRAAAKVESFLASGGDGHDLVNAARRVLFLKGRNAHDYKFSSAVLEDFGHVSPAWRNQFLALSVFNLKGSGDTDSDLVGRVRSALQ